MTNLLEIARKITGDTDEPSDLIEPRFLVHLDDDCDTHRVGVMMANPSSDTMAVPTFFHTHDFADHGECEAFRSKVRRKLVDEYGGSWLALTAYLDESPHWRRREVAFGDWHAEQFQRIQRRHAPATA